MTKLFFHNPGEIDIRSVTIAGLNAKPNTASAIGYFGTGLKYSIASILRWSGQITIHSGTTEYTFTTAETADFRGTEFTQILMHSSAGFQTTPLSFTTEYGKNWEPWQIFRELLSNAKDENGAVSAKPITPAPGLTVIEVDCPAVFDELANMSTIFLSSRNPIYSSDAADCFRGSSNHIYYRGVRVYDRKSLFTYNFKTDLALTEDRTLREHWRAGMRGAEAVMQWTSHADIMAVLTAPSAGYFESDFSYGRFADFTPEFLQTAKTVYRTKPEFRDRVRNFLEANAADALTPQPIPPTPIQLKMLTRAIAICQELGLPTETYPIAIADLGSNILGQYFPETGQVFIAPETFTQGTKQVTSILYEELTHAATGKADLTYDMQTYLFNKIITMYEEYVAKEPI